MPHIIIEHNQNISASNALEIGRHIQKIASSIQEGNFDIDQFKIRSINYQNYIIGLEKNNCENFIHITIKILKGRSLEIRQKLASQSFEYVKNFYHNLKLPQKRCDISLDIIEMDRDLYQKITIR